MNKVGIYYAYWTHEWAVDFVPFVARVKKLGFDVLEVNAGTVADMSREDRRLLRETAAGEGIELTYCIGLPAHYDIASTDAAVRRVGVSYLQKMAVSIGEMHGKMLGGIIYGAWPGKLPLNVPDRRPLVDHSVAAMKQAIKSAEDHGVTFCVEVVNRFEHFVMNTATEALGYVNRVDSAACQILLDTFHMNIEEDGFEQAIRTAGKRLRHFHIGETNRRAPGRGRMAWDEIFRTLAAINYSGAITMEPFLMPGGQVGRDISVFRDLRDGADLDHEAGEALRFVRAKLDR